VRGSRAAVQEGDASKDLSPYVRVLQELDVSQQAAQDRILALVGETVLKNLATRVVLDKEPEEDTAVAAFIQKLKDVPSLHFVPVSP
jgi:hypothetical protein